MVNMTELSDQEQAMLRMADSGNLMAAFNIGKVFQARGENEQAEKYLRIAANGDHLGGIFKLGELLHSLDRNDEAKQYLQTAADRGHKKAAEILSSL